MLIKFGLQFKQLKDAKLLWSMFNEIIMEKQMRPGLKDTTYLQYSSALEQMQYGYVFASCQLQYTWALELSFTHMIYPLFNFKFELVSIPSSHSWGVRYSIQLILGRFLDHTNLVGVLKSNRHGTRDRNCNYINGGFSQYNK